MNPWLETVGVVLVIALSILIGKVFSSFRKPYWMLGYLFPCVLIATLVIARFYNEFYFIRPFWYRVCLASGRRLLFAS